MSGWCLDGVWKVSGRFLKVFGSCTEGVWNMFGRCLEHIYMVSGRSLGGIWKVSERRLEGLWKISVWCLEGLLEYHPVSVGDFGIFLIIQFPSSANLFC